MWVPVSWFLLSDTLTQKLWHAIVSLLLCVSIRVKVLLSRWPSCVDPAYQLDPGLGGTLSAALPMLYFTQFPGLGSCTYISGLST